MKNKKKPSLLMIITNLVGAYVKRLTDLTQLASLEAKLAVKSLIKIIILVYFLGFVFISTWLCLLLVLFLYLVSLQFSWISAAFIITSLNCIIFFIIIFSIFKLKKNIFFPATRRQIGHVRGIINKNLYL